MDNSWIRSVDRRWGRTDKLMKTLLTLLLLALPLSLSAQSLTLTWVDNSDNEDGFIIERSTNRTDFVEIARVGVDVETYTDTEISFNTDYWYRVAAYNEAGTSGFTNIANGKDLPVPVPDDYDRYKFRAKREVMIRQRFLL